MKVEHLVVSILLIHSILSNVEAKVANNEFSVDLIHRDSPLSPLYNFSMSPSEVLLNAALRSISRAKGFYFNNKVQSVVIPDQGEYLAKIFLGTPPVETLVTVETGIELSWVQCMPCKKCYPQDAPYFDPLKSSTYNLVPCVSDQCELLVNRSCGTANQCKYTAIYGDRSTKGVLATDVIKFSSDQSMPPLTSIFGCGIHNVGPSFHKASTGLLGLNGDPLSLISQLGSKFGFKFSTCLVPPSSNATSTLTFGNTSLSGPGVVSTPMIYYGPYKVILESFTTTNNITLPIPYEPEGIIVVDSGTMLTHFEANLYNKFENFILNAIGDQRVQNPPSPFKLCFGAATKAKIPPITFNFLNAPGLIMPTENLFLTVNDLVCLAVVPGDLSILGNLAQTNFVVEYDTKETKISFVGADCALGRRN